MKALVLAAHGSRRQASNEEVIALSRLISKNMAADFPIITTGFLELTEPSIPDAIDLCVQQGATDVQVLPYFLAAGRHVEHDLPAEIVAARKIHTGLPVNVLPHIGGSPNMIGLIQSIARKQ
jgi:sirohydrochlorin ferrochelatase